MNDNSIDHYRRRFLKNAGVTAASAVGGVQLINFANAKSDDQAVADSVRWGMLVDTSKCATDCTACVDSCNEEHGLELFDRPESDVQWIRKVELQNKSTGHQVSLPMLCQHCENPPCVDVCPTGASFKRDDGVVLVNKHTCIGCRYCVMACPYLARSFVHENLENQRSWSPRGKGTVESCNFCVHRVDKGDQPACVVGCQSDGHKALLFGDLNDPDSEISNRASTISSRELRADLSLNTAVRYEGL